jgi:hypothetical protein
MKFFHWVIVLTASMFPNSAYAGTTDSAQNDSDIYLYDTDEIQLPFELIDNRVVITVKHKTQGDMKMLVDTGASTSVLFRSPLIFDNPLPTKGYKRVHFPAFGIRSLGQKIEELPIQTANWYYTLRNIAYIHVPSIMAENTNTLFDGIIGRQLFEDYTVGVNIDTRTLVLTSKDIDISKRYDQSIPLELKTQTPFIKVSAILPWENFTSRKKLMIDTGYPGTIVFWGSKHYKNATASSEYALFQKRDIGFQIQTTFRFGGKRFRKIPTYLQRQSPYYSEKREGIIGTAVLNNYNYAFDYARRKLYLRASTKPIEDKNLIAYPPNGNLFINRKFRNKSESVIGVTTYWLRN